MLVFTVLFFAALFGVFRLGRHVGRVEERERCAGLCAQTFQQGTLSATARRIYASITDGRRVVISEDEFFGPVPWPTTKARKHV